MTTNIHHNMLKYYFFLSNITKLKVGLSISTLRLCWKKSVLKKEKMNQSCHLTMTIIHSSNQPHRCCHVSLVNTGLSFAPYSISEGYSSRLRPKDGLRRPDRWAYGTLQDQNGRNGLNLINQINRFESNQDGTRLNASGEKLWRWYLRDLEKKWKS